MPLYVLIAGAFPARRVLLLRPAPDRPANREKEDEWPPSTLKSPWGDSRVREFFWILQAMLDAHREWLSSWNVTSPGLPGCRRPRETASPVNSWLSKFRAALASPWEGLRKRIVNYALDSVNFLDLRNVLSKYRDVPAGLSSLDKAMLVSRLRMSSLEARRRVVSFSVIRPGDGLGELQKARGGGDPPRAKNGAGLFSGPGPVGCLEPCSRGRLLLDP